MNYNEKLERLRMKLYKTIDERGLDAPETQRISERLDKLINEQHSHEIEYPYGAELKELYYISYAHLKKITKEYGEFPTIKQWTKYAKEMGLLTSVSIEYISGINWNNLRDLILLELK